MDDREEERKKLQAASSEARREADELLDDELEALKRATMTDMERLRPQVGDAAMYQKLIDAVRASTQRNEDIAQLKTRLETLGSKAIAVARTVAGLL
jgi:hypothetical protein